jgi:hypothetical protein
MIQVSAALELVLLSWTWSRHVDLTAQAGQVRLQSQLTDNVVN